MRNRLRKIYWKPPYKNQPKGFTLIELLIYAGMLTILLGVFTTLFGSIVDAQLDADATSSVQQDGQYLLAKLSQDISRSQSIILPSALGDQTTTLELSRGSTSYTYSLDGDGDLVVATSAGNDQLNGYNTVISNLQFIKRGNVGGKNSVTFTFTVTGKTMRSIGAETASFTSTAALR